MSLEYAMIGHFSVNSDAFSFVALVLEILSGERNWCFEHPEHNLNHVGYVWKLWSVQRPLEPMDLILEDSFSENEVKRFIQVGLLCVQQQMEDCPTMLQAFFMQSNRSAWLPEPKEPDFLCRKLLSLSGWNHL